MGLHVPDFWRSAAKATMKPVAAPLLALLPWAASLASILIADRFITWRSVEWSGMGPSASVFLTFVWAPALLPIAVAQHWWSRLTAVAVMTTTSAGAGALTITTDDGQAGLAMLWVGCLAVPLAIVIALVELVAWWAARRPRRVDHRAEQDRQASG